MSSCSFHQRKASQRECGDISLQMIAETSMSGQPAGRTLLQSIETDVKPPIMFNVSGAPCIMLWAQNLLVSLSGSSSEWTDLATQTPSLTGSTCNSSNSRWDDLMLAVLGAVLLLKSIQIFSFCLALGLSSPTRQDSHSGKTLNSWFNNKLLS